MKQKIDPTMFARHLTTTVMKPKQSNIIPLKFKFSSKSNSILICRRFESTHSHEPTSASARSHDSADSIPNGLIELTKQTLTVASATALTALLTSLGGFDGVVGKHLTVSTAHNGRVECTMRVSKELVNAYGGLHGGCIATLVDHCGTLALMSVKPMRPGVSLDITVSYLSSAKLGEELRIVSTALKTGRTIAVADVTIRRMTDDNIIAIGKHTKHIG